MSPEPFTVYLHVPFGSARDRERAGLRLRKPFCRPSACFISALNNIGQSVEEQPSPEGSFWGQDESLDLSHPHLSRAALSSSTGRTHSVPSLCSAAPKHPASPAAPTVPLWETSNRQEKVITNSEAATSQIAKAGGRVF